MVKYVDNFCKNRLYIKLHLFLKSNSILQIIKCGKSSKVKYSDFCASQSERESESCVTSR